MHNAQTHKTIHRADECLFLLTNPCLQSYFSFYARLETGWPLLQTVKYHIIAHENATKNTAYSQ